jgi:uncharacterized protein involved in outer membrane biogenesis
MKKKILIALGIILVLAVVAVVVVVLFLGNIIKAGMETVGPKITQTPWQVDSVSVSLLGGSAAVKGLVLGNPAGYKSAQAIRVGQAAVSVVPGSLLANKIVIRSVTVNAPEITFEGNPFGANNLKKIMDNVNAMASAPATNAPATGSAVQKPAKKLEVDDLLITGAQVHVSLLTGLTTQEMTLPLPPIHLTNLGKDNDGITPAELTREVLGQVTTATFKAVGGAVSDLGKGAADAVKDTGHAVGEGVNKIGKGLGGLFGK